MSMITDKVSISLKTVKESPVYDSSTTMIKVDKVIVVKEGMASGVPSLDFQCTDAAKNKHLIMMTGNIFRAIAVVAKNEFKDGGAPLVNEEPKATVLGLPNNESRYIVGEYGNGIECFVEFLKEGKCKIRFGEKVFEITTELLEIIAKPAP